MKLAAANAVAMRAGAERAAAARADATASGFDRAFDKAREPARGRESEPVVAKRHDASVPPKGQRAGETKGDGGSPAGAEGSRIAPSETQPPTSVERGDELSPDAAPADGEALLEAPGESAGDEAGTDDETVVVLEAIVSGTVAAETVGVDNGGPPASQAAPEADAAAAVGAPVTSAVSMFVAAPGSVGTGAADASQGIGTPPAGAGQGEQGAEGEALSAKPSEPKTHARANQGRAGPDGSAKVMTFEAPVAPATEALPQHEQPARIALSSAETAAGRLALAPQDSSTGTDAANVARVVRGLYSALAAGGGAVTLRLAPPQMGVVRVELHLEQGTVRAELLVQQEPARDLLAQRVGELRMALERHGLVVERLHVDALPNQPAPAQADAGQDQGREQGGQGRQGGGAGGRQGSEQGRRQGRSFDAELLDTLA